MCEIRKEGELTEKLAWLFLEWRRFLQRRLAGYDITLQQMSLLKRLKKSDYLLPHEIADFLHCDRPTASVIIKNLERKGYVNRAKDEGNAKYRRISISKEGNDYLDAIDASLEPLGVSPFDVLSPEENETLYRLLKKCCERTRKIVGKTEKEKENE